MVVAVQGWICLARLVRKVAVLPEPMGVVEEAAGTVNLATLAVTTIIITTTTMVTALVVLVRQEHMLALTSRFRLDRQGLLYQEQILILTMFPILCLMGRL